MLTKQGQEQATCWRGRRHGADGLPLQAVVTRRLGFHVSAHLYPSLYLSLPAWGNNGPRRVHRHLEIWICPRPAQCPPVILADHGHSINFQRVRFTQSRSLKDREDLSVFTFQLATQMISSTDLSAAKEGRISAIPRRFSRMKQSGYFAMMLSPSIIRRFLRISLPIHEPEKRLLSHRSPMQRSSLSPSPSFILMTVQNRACPGSRRS